MQAMSDASTLSISRLLAGLPNKTPTVAGYAAPRRSYIENSTIVI
jgi:hypothetical protein